MTITLDPSQNPLMRLYQLFNLPDVEPRDDARYLGIGNLGLTELGSKDAQELIEFLRRDASDALQMCRLKVGDQPVIDFAAGSPVNWFDKEGISGLAGSSQLSAECHTILADWQQDLEQYRFSGFGQPIDEVVSHCLLVLDELSASESNGQSFTLEIRLEKASLIRKHLLAPFPDVKDRLSVLVWRDAASMLKSYPNFHAFLVRIAQEAGHPVLLLFHEPTEPYHGEYFRIASLGGPPETLAEREQALANSVGAFTSRSLVGYEELGSLHMHEKRSGVGDQYRLSSALLLRRGGELPSYPSHPLLREGPLRSLLIYIFLAWLAEFTTWQDGIARFTMAGGNHVALALGPQDVAWKGKSVFDPNDDGWQNTLVLLAHDMERSAGREALRALWYRAVSKQPAEIYTAGRLFELLDGIRQAFLKAERNPILGKNDLSPDLELRVFFDREDHDQENKGGRLVYELTSDRLDLFHASAGDREVGPKDKEPWMGDLDDMADTFRTRIFEVEDETESPAASGIHELQTWGGFLWDEYIPLSLKLRYLTIRKEPDLNILIVSSDPAFPWELVRPYAARGDLVPDLAPAERIDDDWWAVKFNLARWLAGHRPPANEIRFKRVCLVADTENLPGTKDEVKFLRGLDVELDEPQEKDELLALLGKNRYDVLHISCHGKFNKDFPDESGLLLPDGQRLMPKDFRTADLKETVRASRPLVFLNACHSGQVTSSLTGLRGWAKRFIEMECGACISCGWEVSDSLAARFAIDFYRSFLGGATLGRAVKDARKNIWESDPANSTWLAYYLYGNPNCLVKEPPAVKEPPD